MYSRSHPGKDEVDQTETEGRDQSITLTSTSLSEHCGTVESFEMLMHVFSIENMKSRDLPMMLIPHCRKLVTSQNIHHNRDGALTIC
jgi:hypothetical protein